MGRAAPIASSFNAGELSPRMAGRVNTEVYGAGCHKMENFIPDIAGPAVKRGGTEYIAETKDSAARSWFVDFQRTAADSFMLEFGDQYIRFYTNRAPVLSAGVPYEIASPYRTADLVNADGGFALSYVQSGDVIYLTSRGYAPRKLSRLGTTNWTLTTYDPTGGPFNDVNITATTVYASAASGSGVSLTASAAVFTADMIGTLFYIEQRTISDVKQWEAGKSITAGDTRRAGSRNYVAVNTATTGTVTPTHTEGSVYDGDTGVQWTFLEAGYGWVRITAVGGPTAATCDVLSRLPAGAVGAGNPTTKWATGAWSEGQGYPDSVGFYLDRLCFGRDQTEWMSVAGDYENMQARDAGRQLTDSAITVPIPSRRGNRILWQKALETGLIVGTGADEWIITPASRNDPLGPLNISVNPLGAIGSRNVPPHEMFNAIIFCQRSGRRLRAVRYVVGDGAGYADLNAYADHITSGFRSMTHVAEPYSLIFGAGVDGDLAACTYYPEQSVLGWARFVMSGFVEDVKSIPAPDGTADELWLLVRRTVNGATVRYVEIMKQPLADDGDQADAFYVDCGKTYSGAATRTLTGFDHLEGETINLLVNGATHPQRTVSGGSVTLQVDATKAHGGLPYTATLASMDIEAGAANGTSQAKVKRIWRLAVRLLNTLGGRFGTSATKTDALQFRDATMPMGSPPPLFTGDKSGPAPGGSARSARGWFVHSDPLPATVVAMMPQIETEDA